MANKRIVKSKEKILKWREIRSDEEFASLFKDAIIVEATTTCPEVASLTVDKKHRWLSRQEVNCADVFWRFSNGRWVAMQVIFANGCSTCGFGGSEKIYYTLDPK